LKIYWKNERGYNSQNSSFTTVLAEWSNQLFRFSQEVELVFLDRIFSISGRNASVQHWHPYEVYRRTNLRPWIPEENRTLRRNQAGEICIACVNNIDFAIVSTNTEVGDRICGFKNSRTVALIREISETPGEFKVLSRAAVSTALVGGLKQARVLEGSRGPKFAFWMDFSTLLFVSEDIFKEFNDLTAALPQDEWSEDEKLAST
jgi:hypothetical protein